MPFREGVKDHEVHNFREVVQKARLLDEQIDIGAVSPEEALKELLSLVKAADLTKKPDPIPELVFNVKPEKPKKGTAK